MKYAKLIGLAATAITALMMSAGSAAADTPTSPPGTVYTGPVIGANSGGHVSFHGANGVTWECSMKAEWQITGHGAGKPVTGPTISRSFTNCTNGYVVHMKANGTGSIAATSGGNGTVSSSGEAMLVTASTIFGTISCEYTTSNTSVGTFTGGFESSVDLSMTLPRTGGSSLCGSSAAVTGKIKYTAPSDFRIDKT